MHHPSIKKSLDYVGHALVIAYCNSSKRILIQKSQILFWDKNKNKCFLTLFLLVEFSNMRLYAVVVLRDTGDKPKKLTLHMYLRIRIATYHNGCFWEFLSKNYLRPILILGTIEQQILQNVATIFMSIFKVDVTMSLYFFWFLTHWYVPKI